MAEFVSDDVVVVPFPFTDLTSAKIPPALVLAGLTRGDLILCQITSTAAGPPSLSQFKRRISIPAVPCRAPHSYRVSG